MGESRELWEAHRTVGLTGNCGKEQRTVGEKGTVGDRRNCGRDRELWVTENCGKEITERI